DLESCRRACRDVAVVFHQAALGSVPRSLRDPSTTMAVNVGGTANVFAAAREAGVRRIVYASSSSVYGDDPTLPKREGREGRPLSPYALSKRVDEELAEVFGRCFGLELIGLRYFNVYGPRQDPDGPYAAVVPRFFRAGLREQPAVIYGDGEQSRDFTYVADAVSANLLAARAPASACGAAYNVAGGRRITINALAGEIAQRTGSGVPARHEAERPGDVRHSEADLSLAQEKLGYAPRFSLSQGLQETEPFYRIPAAPEARAR
ncbi:MAG TPA: NAD-dependent epimerase/dehydratase family protein, partial [Thermoanaerobaculia bacterium]